MQEQFYCTAKFDGCNGNFFIMHGDAAWWSNNRALDFELRGSQFELAMVPGCFVQDTFSYLTTG